MLIVMVEFTLKHSERRFEKVPSPNFGKVQLLYELVKSSFHTFLNEIVQLRVRNSNFVNEIPNSKNERVPSTFFISVCGIQLLPSDVGGQ